MNLTDTSLIFLIGPRGSGKSTVARLLAERLGWAWHDADTVLEERAGRTIREIFAVESEEGFRIREVQTLAELSRLQNAVVATGGGVILKPENRALLRTGYVVWLTAAPEILHERMQADAATSQRRPPLAQGGLEEVRDILKRREPLYRESAHFTVETTNLIPDHVVGCIVKQLSEPPA